VLDAMPQDCIPRGYGTPVPFLLRESLLGVLTLAGVQIPEKVSWRVFEERYPEFRDLGRLLCQCFAPFGGEPDVHLTAIEVALFPVVKTALPADERLRESLFRAPVAEPRYTSPVHMEVSEQSVGHVQSHNQWPDPSLPFASML
jgi:hypothetical protein